VLSTAALRGVVEHVPADLTVTVRAGTPLRDLQAALAERGQFLPADPPHRAATVGGIIAANSNGFGTLRYGAIRDILIGTTTALCDGSLARAGGRVVKNVAGYDLNKLLVGSRGTLGVMVEATFKVLPLPAARGACVLRPADAAGAFATAASIVRTSLRPTALVVDRDGRGWRLTVAAAGERAVVARTLREAGGEPLADAEDVLESLRELPATAGDGVLIRAVVPLAAQAAFADAIVRLDSSARIVADAGTGVVRAHHRGDDVAAAASADAAIAAARVLGGTARVEKVSAALRERMAVAAETEPPGHFLMRRLKEAFDPHGILEPGRAVA
jgi:glycolate oxidase FAD binding subunit